MNSIESDDRIYKVVVHVSGRYSLWPDEYEIPLGWKGAGKIGLLSECIQFIQAQTGRDQEEMLNF